MISEDDGAPPGQSDWRQEITTAPSSEVIIGASWVRVGAAVVVALAAMLAWEWPRKAFALTWPIVGVFLGAITGKLLGPRGERALSAWRAWASAWQAIPAEPSKQPGLETTTTYLGMAIGLTISFGLVDGWPRFAGLWTAVFIMLVVIPALGRWVGTSIIRIAIIWVTSFLLWVWHWEAIAYSTMPMRALKVLAISAVYACLCAAPFLWNLRLARRHAASDPGS